MRRAGQPRRPQAASVRSERVARYELWRRESEIGRVAADEDLENAVVRRRMIDQALARLPPDMRLLITLRDVQGLDIARSR